MGIFFLAEDKDGEQASDVVELSRIQRHFPMMDQAVCLRFVSEADDASFNQAQLPLLLDELAALDAKVTKKEEKDELARVIAICQKCKGRKHVSIKFYGEGVGD